MKSSLFILKHRYGIDSSTISNQKCIIILHHLKCFLRIKYFKNSPFVTIYACIHQSIPSQYGIPKYFSSMYECYLTLH